MNDRIIILQKNIKLLLDDDRPNWPGRLLVTASNNTWTTNNKDDERIHAMCDYLNSESTIFPSRNDNILTDGIGGHDMIHVVTQNLLELWEEYMGKILGNDYGKIVLMCNIIMVELASMELNIKINDIKLSDLRKHYYPIKLGITNNMLNILKSKIVSWRMAIKLAT